MPTVGGSGVVPPRRPGHRPPTLVARASPRHPAAIRRRSTMTLPRTATFLFTVLAATGSMAADDDPYLWLEEVAGEKAVEWVEDRSAEDTAELEKVPEFDPIHQRLLEILNSRDRIPYAGFRGEWLYNFWQDEDHVRGVWRRTFLDSYVTGDPAWETVLDVDALAAAEEENWVFKGGF